MALSVDVFVVPKRLYPAPGELGPGEEPTWAPSSSTLIRGTSEAILIDALLTVENADAIAAWAKGFGTPITGVYITHGHSDHWLGLARLLEHFPEATGYAAPEVVARAAYEVEFNARTGYWSSRFPGELPETPMLPEALTADEIEVDGEVVRVVHVGQGDCAGSTVFHVPSADAVVCGDVTYNDVHMMMYEADASKREEWIASIDAVAALAPRIVVSGHKKVGNPDLPGDLAASQQYLRDFSEVAALGGTVEEFVVEMTSRHPTRDNLHTLWISARAEVARRA